MKSSFNVNDVVHYYCIKVKNKKIGNGDIVEFLKWENLRFEMATKWKWYFEYRAALLQVKYPKFRVETSWGHESATGKHLEISLANKKRSKKAKITEYQNKLEKYKKQWNSIFPIEDDIAYQNAVKKIERLKAELNNFD